MWTYREGLTYYEKIRRSLYEILRDALERRLIKIALIDSYYNFQENGVDYTFLDKSELKPKSKKMESESGLFNTFLVIFSEGVISPNLKNYIRFFPENSVIKRNLEYLPNLSLYKRFNKNLRYFEGPGFLDLVKELSIVDYALLIQQDPSVKKRNRYSLTNFHVKIDCPIADAAEDLAKSLYYIQNNLYENSDNEARILQNKLFEYYGCHYNAGGRRTAGLIAAQLLRGQDYISTVFVSSSESRIMYKYSERGVSKYFLVQLTEEQVTYLAQREGIRLNTFKTTYLYPERDSYVGILEAQFSHTLHSTPPEDAKLRKLKPAYNWLKLTDELLHPNVTALTARPINHNWIYSTNG